MNIQETLNSVSETTDFLLDHDGIKLACRKGCSSCCKQPVVVSLPEARHVLDAYHAQYGDKAFKRLLKRTKRDWVKVGLVETPEEYMQTGVKCPFLSHGSCSVYNSRPVVCREMWHTDRTMCEQDLHLGRQGLPGVLDEWWSRKHDAVTKAVRARLADEGLEIKDNSLLMLQTAIGEIATGHADDEGTHIDPYTMAMLKRFNPGALKGKLEIVSGDVA